MENIPEQIRKQLQNGEQDPQALLRFAGQTLDEERQKALHSLLDDPQALARILQSEKAQALLRQLQK